MPMIVNNDPMRLRDLERENARLKRLVAECALDIEILKEVNWGNFCTQLAAGPRLTT